VTEFSTVVVGTTDHVAQVRLNRPETKNAVDGVMFRELREVALDLAATPSVRAVVLSGAGGSFCSGLDRSAIASMSSGTVGADVVAGTAELALSTDGATPFQQIAWAWHELPVPVIAAIEGRSVAASTSHWPPTFG
jgi:enoyl-CoA hydratase/carnithine racemase